MIFDLLRSARRGLLFVTAALVVSTLAVGCGSSSSSAGITCKNPPSTGPDSAACATCGAQQCPDEQAAVESSCASLVSCIEACDCTGGSCEAGCIAATDKNCEQLITALGDCEKMASACQKACTQ
jgi:hypothetical protein